MMRTTTVCLGLLFLASGSLVAQEDPLDRVRQQLPPEAAERIELILEEAGATGIPAEPLVAKALEGAAKRVPADRVISAVAEYADRLRTAGELLPADRGSASLVAAAGALRRGVPAEAVRGLGRDAGENAPVALVVLGDLYDLGMPVEGAMKVVEAAMEQGGEGDELLSVSDVARRLVRQGTPPDEAARALQRDMAGGGPPPWAPGSELGRGPPGISSGPPVPPGAGPPGSGSPGDDPSDPPVGDPPTGPPGG